MTDEKKNALRFYFQHIDHAIQVAGIDHVCIGSDRDHRIVSMSPEYIAELKAEGGDNFDDAHWPLYFEELNGPRRMEVVWDGIVKLGYSEDQVEKVMGKNLYRLYKNVLG
jgi:membrane dipeptidase